jgi:hypothetical protein
MPVDTIPADQNAMATSNQSADTAIQTDTNTQAYLSTPAAEQPFTLLDPKQHQLNRIIRRILTSADYRLLFHQAWRQPIRNRNESENILIRGGDQFDNHYELEGYINLSVERYLHIDTDLWLSTFVHKNDGESEPWPKLPSVPLGSVASSSTVYNDNFSSATNTTNNTATFFDNPFVDTMASQFSVARSITLRQHRRMRSNELHYIDHPLMGLLIKITPYELPEPKITKPISGEHKPTVATAKEPPL